jgi:1-acyl-sn-glycerol-3-phosphate acyltransferase
MNSELIYQPKSKAKMNKSPLYGFNMFARVLGLSARFLQRALLKESSVELADEYIEKFWRANFDATKTTLLASGRNNLDKNRTYVYMSNHESWMDIPAIFGAVPQSVRMIAKEGLTRLPIFGKALLKAGFIPVDRKNRLKAINQLDVAQKRLKSGLSIWLAPEGTRTRSGDIAQFKKGGFFLSLNLNYPIVPVYIDGAANVLAADSLTVYPNKKITVHIGSPVETNGYDRKSLNELVEKVRNEIILLKEKASREGKSDV